MSVGFRPSQEDNEIIQAHKRPDESTSDVLRRALRALDRERWDKQAREDMERIAASGEDLSDEQDEWGYDEDGRATDLRGRTTKMTGENTGTGTVHWFHHDTLKAALSLKPFEHTTPLLLSPLSVRVPDTAKTAELIRGFAEITDAPSEQARLFGWHSSFALPVFSASDCALVDMDIAEAVREADALIPVSVKGSETLVRQHSGEARAASWNLTRLKLARLRAARAAARRARKR
ncbi:hypothetical protein [Streptomyces phaeolivaceus]|uniref:hypothetical protein n=1 Tax=Streptomyces phaeolivaceus TaxID=2653200 RepID=UPI001D03AC9C|nr:hypothetical protein [Streptomyces phaeolivaceus]